MTRTRTKLGKRILTMLLALTMTMSVAVASHAGPITRNAVAIGAVGLHAASHVASATNAAYSALKLPISVPLGATALNPIAPIGLGARTVLLLSGDAAQIVPLTGWTLAQVGKVATIPPIAHAVIWNGIDLALLGTSAVVGTSAVALGTTALVGTGLALGAGALGTTALVGTGLALGTGALATTAVVGTGAALGAGALATTAVVGTGAALGTAYVAHKILSPIKTLTSIPTTASAATETANAATVAEDLPIVGTAMTVAKDVANQVGLTQTAETAKATVDNAIASTVATSVV